MIQTKKDLLYYIEEDLKRFNGKKPKLIDWLLHNEVWYIFNYIRQLRYIEYYRNKNTLLFLWHFFWYKRLGFKLRMTIYPNTIGPGFRIYHAGDFVHVGSNVRIGKNCTMLPGVVFGNKTEEADIRPVTVGDDCYFGLGCKIFGPVHIGNNVTIGANAVVTKDIPDNAIVGGIPAKIIRIKK
ncbi:DapH/DapD/GlmU-related protein [uncultured Bacteroides sp.]|uniref:serine O-acetyltransferase n=1 Tax=uncultured Bacteroides sp. TaxID=162156 RepID=UPI0025E334B1|nr:DapH/DapD/GlmU-related protein [uncultured Bacteroides sp.]